MPSPFQQEKRRLRALARARRLAVENADELSRVILERALELPAYRHARAVLLYVDTGSEVRTRPFLPRVLAEGKTLLVPWCEDDELRLFRLRAVDELAPGRYNILEPRPELRGESERQAPAESVDVAFTPGVAFDPQGRRLGQGRGYYDRLLPRLRPDATIVGLAFQAQILPQIPAEEHDVQMHYVVTETTVYDLVMGH
jgi:5-formyltetrahydrofolate cyclo-ligase